MQASVGNCCKLCLKLVSQGQNLVMNSKMFSTSKVIQTSVWHVARYSSRKTMGDRKGDESEEDLDAPLKFSTSKAARWSVEKSFGAQYKRPWWKVAPVSLAMLALVSWIFLRSETDIDKELEKSLSDRLPHLFAPSKQESDKEEDAEKINAHKS